MRGFCSYSVYAISIIFEKVLYFFVRNHLLIKNVCSSFRRFYHFDNLGISTTFFLNLRANLLLFSLPWVILLLLFNFLVYCYSLQNWVVFFQLKSFCSILSVLSCDITRCSRHSTVFVFCTFQNHLYSVTFCFLCHCKFSPLRLADYFNAFPITITFSHCFSQRSIQSFLLIIRNPLAQRLRLIQQSCST